MTNVGKLLLCTTGLFFALAISLVSVTFSLLFNAAFIAFSSYSIAAAISKMKSSSNGTGRRYIIAAALCIASMLLFVVFAIVPRLFPELAIWHPLAGMDLSDYASVVSQSSMACSFASLLLSSRNDTD